MRWRFALILLLLSAGCLVGRPSGPAQSSSALRRADDSYQRGDYAEAILLYRSYLSTNPADDAYVQTSYRLASAYYRLGRYDEAADVIDDLRARYPEGQWPTVFALYGDIEQARGHNVSALLWWERGYVVASDAERGQLSTRIAGLAENMSDDERRQVRPLVTTDFVRRALDAPRRPVLPSATPTTELIPATPTSTPGPESARIALMLPLSGKYRPVGTASLDGARVAVRHDEDLYAVDTKANPAVAVQDYESLLGDVSVVAAVGPLRADEAAAVAGRATSGDLPVLLLAQSEGLGGPSLLQIGMTRSLQVQILVAYTVRKLGLRNFAVIHPGDAFGSSFARAFRSAVQAEGGQVVTVATYTPGAVDFVDEIDQLQAANNRLPIEAVFLPDSAATVALLAPDLKRALPQVQLLGSSDWNEGSILAGAARTLDGAVFVDGFFADSSRPATREFVERFRRRYGRKPGLLEAQAHDAVAIIEEAIRRGSFSRQEIDLMLDDFGTFEGASGTMEISAGIVRRQLFLLRLREGGVEELSW